jgi:GT2 family glycosyltransferase
MNPSVGIIVMNRNQAAYTRDCLASLRAVDYSTFRTLVVDNGSEDSSLQEVAGAFPEVDFLWIKENLGVAGGRNAGIRHLIPLSPEYVLFLDNDTFVAPDFLSRLVAQMQRDPRIGAVQPKIYFAEPPNGICSVGGRLYPRISYYRHPGSGQIESTKLEGATEIDIVSGCAGLMRATVFRNVGLLDETFSPYCHEDVDWSLRLRKAGYRLVLEPSAIVWHRVSGSPKVNPDKLAKLVKGHTLFLRFHTRIVDLPLSVAWISIHLLRRFILPALVRSDWASFAAVFKGIREGIEQKRIPIEVVPEFLCTPSALNRTNGTASAVLEVDCKPNSANLEAPVSHH